MVGAVKDTEEYFAKLHDRFVPENAKGLNATFQYELSGDGGGEWFADIKDGVLETVSTGRTEKPTLTIKMDAKHFIDMANGDLDGTKAFMTRKLKVKGNVAMAQKMKKFLPPAK
ncbi:MAG: SCP2 sterol-binding domain-containing protein [Myxococcales bacterium]|nr:SCP2 sterol-binding domain-containing protein [Myxococcales bacterium]